MTNPSNPTELGNSLVRRVMTMVAVLHSRGLESLYLHSAMSGTGGWRYRIGAMEAQQWPRRDRDPLQIFNSMKGGDDPEQIDWGGLYDDPVILADRFAAHYPRIAEAARVPNPAHVAWYQHMLAVSEPQGMLVYEFDYKTGPRPEFWGGTKGSRSTTGADYSRHFLHLIVRLAPGDRFDYSIAVPSRSDRTTFTSSTVTQK